MARRNRALTSGSSRSSGSAMAVTVRANTARLEEVSGQLQGLAGQVQGLASQVQGLTGQVQTMSGHFQELSADVRANGVRIEQMQSHLVAVIEALGATRDELRRDLKEMEERLSLRISILEEVVRKNSEDIRKNSEDIQELRAELARLRHDFDHRRELEQMASLERRVAALEARLGVTA